MRGEAVQVRCPGTRVLLQGRGFVCWLRLELQCFPSIIHELAICALCMRSCGWCPGGDNHLAVNGLRLPLSLVPCANHRKAMGVIGTKAGMMSYFTADGLCVPATVIALEEGNIVTQVKTADTDGYNAVQVGYQVVAERKVKKPELGHLNKAGCPPMRHLVEFKVRAPE